MPEQPLSLSGFPSYRLRYDTPSPIHQFTTLSATAASNDKISIQTWIKRDDQSSPMLCCGNKYRKLEYIIPDILAKPGITTIVTEGGLQSNHAAQTAVVAAKLGLECVILLNEEAGGLKTAENQTIFRSTGNVPVFDLLGANVHIQRDPHDKIAVLQALKAEGKVPYWIPMGSSQHPLGGLGYTNCALEIQEQEKTLKLEGTGRYDYIFVACGSGSTLAGLVAGFKLLESSLPDKLSVPKRQLIGVMVAPITGQEEVVLQIARNAGKLVGLDPERDIAAEDIRLDHRFAGPGYGVLDEETRKTLKTLACSEGILIDPVYSGKAAKGLIHWVNSGELQSDASKVGHQPGATVNVLFIHTGGQNVSSAYAA
ncbi:hypothetical protein Brms1b_011077 [Colletotrichum noveboracense]|nr:hypothetical protein Brms1b_011077 [Colletotrichum noveboracense]